ncbi:MAG: hypothetical protein KZQ99_22110 [Candidatus Thiodiazotropha sp. (ex Dulcina madagascariensis)]|nr:hypothetical protein [Candidatus Thiodiazotropha sp. (ex Dulcina madagascariensis)]
MKIGLRVCVNTLSGAVQGVPALLKLFDEYQVQASFFFATGPDKSGRLIGQALQPWYRNLDFVSRLLRPGVIPAIELPAGSRSDAVSGVSGP